MKNSTKLILSVLCAIVMIGCQTDNTATTANEKGSTLFSISLEDSRISLGEKVGDIYPAFWSEGDRIVVNGVISEEVVITADKHPFTHKENLTQGKKVH